MLGKYLLLSVACSLAAFSWAASAAESDSLRAGAARVDITPAKDSALPMSGYAERTQGHQGVHDNLYVRALVVDDGANRAAIVVWELIGIPTAVWKELSQRITKETGIPAENLVIAGVHSHGAPSLKGGYTEVPPRSVEYTSKVEDAAAEAVRQAIQKLQRARAGFGSGQAFINVNRRELMPSGLWWLGYNPDFPSDKTVAVLKFETPSGEPIAMLANYPVHARDAGRQEPASHRRPGRSNIAIRRAAVQGQSGRLVDQRLRGRPEPSRARNRFGFYSGRCLRADPRRRNRPRRRPHQNNRPAPAFAEHSGWRRARANA